MILRFLPVYPTRHSFCTAAFKASALKAPKRFYEKVNICKVNSNEPSTTKGNECKVRLDERELRTPRGRILQLPELLALMIAQEWEAQKDEIRQDTMHLTGLAFTATDNPYNETKESLLKKMLTYLQTDTILYFADRENSLCDDQRKYWGPLILWANSHFGLSLQPTDEIVGQPHIPPESSAALEKHLQIYNFPSLIGLTYATEALRSLLIPLATLPPQNMDVENAVKLARLEQIHQTNVWKSVEWAHDTDHFEQCARLSAALLFIHSYHTQ